MTRLPRIARKPRKTARQEWDERLAELATASHTTHRTGPAITYSWDEATGAESATPVVRCYDCDVTLGIMDELDVQTKGAN